MIDIPLGNIPLLNFEKHTQQISSNLKIYLYKINSYENITQTYSVFYLRYVKQECRFLIVTKRVFCSFFYNQRLLINYHTKLPRNNHKNPTSFRIPSGKLKSILFCLYMLYY